MKKSALILLLTVIVLCLASCGADNCDKLMGTWTLTKVNGAGLEQYAAAIGREVSDAAVNYTFYEDMAVEKTGNGENELSVDWEKDGVTVTAEKFFSYNAENDILTVNDGNYIYTYTRGVYNFDKAD